MLLTSLIAGIAGGVIGAGGAVAAQFVSHWLTSGRERTRFKIASFERFASQLSNDPELRRIRNKKEPLTDEEIEYYLEFLEEIGVYFGRDLIDVELLDECLGDDIMDCYEDDRIMKWVGSVRGEERDDTYFMYFERMARSLIKQRERRLGSRP